MAASPPPAPGRIFISYRREETAFPAGWLYDRLAERFTDGQVFKDVDSIELGDDFVEVISTAVGSCDVLLALIGHQWLTITDEDGHRRLEDPNDFVRVEIEAALARNVRVIPILVEGARMPRATELPPSLARLVRRQALELHPSRFDFDTGRLLRVLERTLVEVRTAERETIATPPPTAPAKPPEPSTTELPKAPERQEQAIPTQTPTAGTSSAAARPGATPPPKAPAKPPDSSTTELPKAPDTRPPPRLELSATVVDFGRLPQHSQSPERTVRIANAGGGALNAQAATQASWLKLRHEGDDLVIAVDTTTVGQHKGIVAVDSDGGAAMISVTADMDPSPVPAPEPPTAATGQPPTAGQTTTGRVQEPPSRPAPPPAHALPDGQVDQKARESRSPRKTDRDYEGVRLATWGQRLIAGIVDFLPWIPGLILFFVGIAGPCPADPNVSCTPASAGRQVWAGIGVALIVASKVYNRWYLQGTTGQSWGKRRHQLRLVRMTDKQPIGFRSAFVRGLAHILDIGTLGVGYLLPLWDKRRQTLADAVMGTIVISQDKTGSSGSQTS
jgi:uncharacterized RDD family membrane protein YckC